MFTAGRNTNLCPVRRILWNNFTFMWPCIVTNFFVIKPTRCTNFTNSTCFGQFVCPSSGVYSLYTQQWYMSYRSVDSFRAGPGWNTFPSWSCLKAVFKPVWHIPLLGVQWINSWCWTDELSETRRVSCQNKFVKLVHLVGFIIEILWTIWCYCQFGPGQIGNY